MLLIRVALLALSVLLFHATADVNGCARAISVIMFTGVRTSLGNFPYRWLTQNTVRKESRAEGSAGICGGGGPDRREAQS